MPKKKTNNGGEPNESGLFFTSPEDDLNESDFMKFDSPGLDLITPIELDDDAIEEELDEMQNDFVFSSVIPDKKKTEEKPVKNKKERALKADKAEAVEEDTKKNDEKASIEKPEKATLKKANDKKAKEPSENSAEKTKKSVEKTEKEKTPKIKKVKESKIKKVKNREEKITKVEKALPLPLYILSLVGKLVLICAIVAGMLAFVHEMTEPIITQNEIEKKEAALKEIFPEMTSYEKIDDFAADVDELYRILLEDEWIGYCASVSPSGFGGEIEMMVGVSHAKRIMGINVIGHSETPNVGTKALDGAYLSEYIPLGPLLEGEDSIKLGDTIDACAGATISSKAVNTGINSALSAWNDVFASYVPPEAKIGVVSLDEALYGADGYGGFYGWITDEHIETRYAEEENFSPFEDIVTSSVRLEDGTMHDQGYAATLSVQTDSGSARIVVGTYYNTVLGVRFLDYEGEGFEKLARDTEYMKNYKMNISNPKPLVYGENIPIFEEADEEARLIAQKATEVLAYYPEYLEAVSESKEVSENE